MNGRSCVLGVPNTQRWKLGDRGYNIYVVSGGPRKSRPQACPDLGQEGMEICSLNVFDSIVRLLSRPVHNTMRLGEIQTMQFWLKNVRIAW